MNTGIVLTTLSVLFMNLGLLAQTADYPVSIGLFAGPVDYYGDFDNHSVFDFGGEDTYFQFGADLGFYVNPAFDFMLDLSLGDLGHRKENGDYFEGGLIAFDIGMKFKFNNGKLLKEDCVIAPYLFAGGGIQGISGSDEEINEGLISAANYGVGFNVPLSAKLSFDLRNTYKYLSTDNLDYLGDNLNDNIMTLTLGLKLNLGKLQDTDGDGISDKQDACPEVAGLEAFMGCPDTDGDSIADAEDKCPTQAGLTALMGCPDSDGDGVTDAEDTCPNKAGTAAMAGCPDSDNDGVADNLDACPEKAGPAALKGCPDKDGDGITDADDACPDTAGLAALKGCPDRDNDGIADNKDSCPDTAGIASNKGCPAVSAEVEQVFTQALKGIQFESGRDVIKGASYTLLDKVLNVMTENPSYKLFIQGHTDSQGDDMGNLNLSKRRAMAVLNYLENNGLAETRLRSEGFGETKPLADNKTAAGRAQNRRVEFKVEF